MKKRIDFLTRQLHLMPHPEGGLYAPAYRSSAYIDAHLLPNGNWKEKRNLYSSIYYLLQKDQYSAWHRLASDEIWHFYEGDPVTLHLLDKNGVYRRQILGVHEDNTQYQWLVMGGTWMAATTAGTKGYSLVGCTLSPGFEFEDLEWGTEQQLKALYPNLTKEMKALLPRP